MTMVLENFPYGETVIAALLAFGLGLLWYHPKMMGARWLAARDKVTTGVNMEPLSAATSLALWLLSACFYSFLLIILNVDDLNTMLSLSCLLWVAFVMPPLMLASLYTGYPFQAVAIDAAYHLGGYYIFAMVHALVPLAMSSV